MSEIGSGRLSDGDVGTRGGSRRDLVRNQLIAIGNITQSGAVSPIMHLRS